MEGVVTLLSVQIPLKYEDSCVIIVSEVLREPSAHYFRLRLNTCTSPYLLPSRLWSIPVLCRAIIICMHMHIIKCKMESNLNTDCKSIKRSNTYLCLNQVIIVNVYWSKILITNGSIGLMTSWDSHMGFICKPGAHSVSWNCFCLQVCMCACACVCVYPHPEGIIDQWHDIVWYRPCVIG